MTKKQIKKQVRSLKIKFIKIMDSERMFNYNGKDDNFLDGLNSVFGKLCSTCEAMDKVLDS